MVLALWTKAPRNGFVNRPDVLRFTINGRTWPSTERLSYGLGDTVRFPSEGLRIHVAGV